MLGEIWIWPMCCLQPWFIHHLDCPPHLTLSEPWLWTTYKVAEADHGTWRGTWGQCHEHRSYIHVDIIFFMWILFIHVARWMCNMYSINSKLIQCRRERNEMCILDRCDRLVYLPFLLYEVTIGTIGCWWYPFSNSVFIGVLVPGKKRSSSADRFRQSLPSLLLGRIPWTRQWNFIHVNPPTTMIPPVEWPLLWVGAFPHFLQGSSEWSGQVLVGKIFAWSLAFFWKGWNPSHHWMELLRVNSGGGGGDY